MHVVRSSSGEVGVNKHVLWCALQVSWDDIGGLADVKQQLKEAVELPFLHPDAVERLGIVPPKGEEALYSRAATHSLHLHTTPMPPPANHQHHQKLYAALAYRHFAARTAGLQQNIAGQSGGITGQAQLHLCEGIRVIQQGMPCPTSCVYWLVFVCLHPHSMVLCRSAAAVSRREREGPCFPVC